MVMITMVRMMFMPTNNDYDVYDVYDEEKMRRIMMTMLKQKLWLQDERQVLFRCQMRCATKRVGRRPGSRHLPCSTASMLGIGFQEIQLPSNPHHSGYCTFA